MAPSPPPRSLTAPSPPPRSTAAQASNGFILAANGIGGVDWVAAPTGGTYTPGSPIDGAPIGQTTAAPGKFSILIATGNFTAGGHVHLHRPVDLQQHAQRRRCDNPEWLALRHRHVHLRRFDDFQRPLDLQQLTDSRRNVCRHRCDDAWRHTLGCWRHDVHWHGCPPDSPELDHWRRQRVRA